MSGPAFDEGLPKRDYWGEELPYKCKFHPERVAVDPISYRQCRECFEEAAATYVDKAIKRDKETPQWLRELRTGNPGETLGMAGREATHAMLTKISREKPE